MDGSFIKVFEHETLLNGNQLNTRKNVKHDPSGTEGKRRKEKIIRGKEGTEREEGR